MSSRAAAQIAVTAPGAGGAVLRSCDDYAARELNNPWDMSDAADVVTLLPGIDFAGFSSVQFVSGEFVGVTNAAAPFFYLISPPIPTSQPAAGQRGFDRPIDPTKYNRLSFRIFSSSDSANQEFRLLWNHGWGYSPNFSISAIQQFYLKPGWNTYTVDLNAVALQNEGTPRPWASESVTGLRLGFHLPAGTTIKVDWVSLYASSGCQDGTVSVQANQTNDARFYVPLIDTDGDPLNGVTQQLAAPQAATGTQNFTVSSAGLYPGSQMVSALGSSDYATLYRLDPWDMSAATDILAAGGVTNPRFEGGVYRGTTATSALVYLKLGTTGIAASSFSRLSFKLERTSAASFFIYWNGGSRIVNPAVDDADSDNVYQINLSGAPGWSGTITELYLNPAISAGVDFGLDFVALEAVSFRTAAPTPTVVTAAGQLRVNAPPLVTIHQPDAIGGEGRYPWNMGTFADVPIVENLTTAQILPFNLVDSLVGDFFYGVNRANNDDPINWSRFFTQGPADIDTSVFYRLTYRLLVTGEVDLVLGSVARVYWSSDRLVTSGQSEDIPVYGGWNTYTVDLRSILLEAGSATWTGTVDSFRVDSHEFMAARPYYFDFIHLRADDRANGQFVIAYTITDADDPDADLGVDIAYSTSSSCSAPTTIASFTVSDRAAEKGSLLWNTSGVPAGSYYVCLTVSDGLNLNTRVSSGVVRVTATFNDTEPPVMALVAPTEGAVFDSVLQIKGYALDQIQLAEVRVLIDGAFFGVFYPDEFDPTARTAYPAFIDSSNAGLNVVLDTSALALGAHTVEVRARDTSGNVLTRSFNVTKQAGAALVIIPADTPNGVPADLPPPSGSLKTPAIMNIKSDKKGTISFKVKKFNSNCTVSVLAGSGPKSLNTVLFSGVVSAAQVTSGLSFRATKVPGSKSSIYLQAKNDCGTTRVRTSAKKMVAAIGPGGRRASIKTVLKRLRKTFRLVA
jgi:hypothetical protein